MREAILWVGYNRPEYAKVSLESIFRADNRPEDIFAYVDNDNSIRSLEVVNLLKSFGVNNICFREKRYSCSPNILKAYVDFFSKGYDICHYIEDDIIVSKNYFSKAKEHLAVENIIMFCGCILVDEERNKIYPRFSTWGSSFKKLLFERLEPYIEGFLEAWDNGTTIEYQKNNFDCVDVNGFDGLIGNVVRKYKLLSSYPERSYSKDIGVYGYHREKGIPPVKTLEEWGFEEPFGAIGYGINGIDFKLD